MRLTAKCIMHMYIEDSVRAGYERQRGCMNVECWANTLKETKRVEALHKFGKSAGK